MQERRKSPETEDIPRELLDLGIRQLETEIRVIESWLRGLAETREDNHATGAFRQTYNDMLQSRKDLLNFLSTRRNAEKTHAR